MADNLDDWLTAGDYLPEFMRDFDDHKDLFKALNEVVQRRVAKGGLHVADVSWVAVQVYVVDVFLWVLASRGYTLQRSSEPFAFGAIEDFVKATKERRWAEFHAALRADLGRDCSPNKNRRTVPPTPASLFDP